ncbi:nodulin MtN21 /EamA-like transporter family protein [Perilla frutescens var. hirtella]|uniref:WAT1-related protein n=1 Tax=Perilla frutescens var. hirtella TaxID=608512 RepID=A0AAD4IRA8_PERFH|nr:nodulin MtN21 /EamA-like transporter family protein [Perilla frutescens var. hirtella]
MISFLSMVIVQMGYAGMNIISKLAMDSGMNPFVHVAYRQIFATLAIAPLAYFIERKTRPKMTLSILFQIFLCSIFGVTVNQITYFVGLKNSTPTIACALSNINPAVTFIMAVPFGLEKLGVKSKAGQAKIVGTILCVGGALFLSFYEGSVVNIGQSSIHWKYAEKTGTKNSINAHGNLLLGPFLLILSAVSWAVWLIIQTRVSQQYSAPYSSSAIMCAMASIQCVVVGFAFDPTLSAWSLTSSIRLVSAIYAGIICSALAFCLMSWCIERKGPLYVSVFSPLLLVIVAILSWALLDEKLYVGTVVGSVLIVLGLYGVLWGKNRETSCIQYDVEVEGEKKPTTIGEYDLESLASKSANI